MCNLCGINEEVRNTIVCLSPCDKVREIKGVFPLLGSIHCKDARLLKTISGEFPILKSFDIFFCDEIESIDIDAPVLHQFRLYRCSKLIEIPKKLPNVTNFEMTLVDNITYVPELPNVEIFMLGGCPKICRVTQNMPKLVKFNMHDMDNLEQLPDYLGNEVHISRARSLKSIPEYSSLKILRINNARLILSIPNIDYDDLFIRDCPWLPNSYDHDRYKFAKRINILKRCQRHFRERSNFRMFVKGWYCGGTEKSSLKKLTKNKLYEPKLLKLISQYTMLEVTNDTRDL
jgi:hypothetical protein